MIKILFLIILRIIIYVIIFISIYKLLDLNENKNILKGGIAFIIILIIYSIISIKKYDLKNTLDEGIIKKKSFNSHEISFVEKDNLLYIYNKKNNSIEKLDLLPADIFISRANNINANIIKITGTNYTHAGMFVGHLVDNKEYSNRIKEIELIKNKKLDIKKAKSKIHIPTEFKIVNLIMLEANNNKKNKKKSGVNYRKLNEKFYDFKIGLNTKEISFIRLKDISLDKRNEILNHAYEEIGGNYSYYTINSLGLATA